MQHKRSQSKIKTQFLAHKYLIPVYETSLLVTISDKMIRRVSRHAEWEYWKHSSETRKLFPLAMENLQFLQSQSLRPSRGVIFLASFKCIMNSEFVWNPLLKASESRPHVNPINLWNSLFYMWRHKWLELIRNSGLPEVNFEDCPPSLHPLFPPTA